MLVQRFGIFWSSLKCSVAHSTLIIMVACKLHNYIIDSSTDLQSKYLEAQRESNVTEMPLVYLQCEVSPDGSCVGRTERQQEYLNDRNTVASRLVDLGFVRPRNRN